ncbi:uncharacterized protein [Neodiprion pinetum]|uniref:uncharacterized protein n=1 Tax=Neodiprion pinetum TaxID=441929 RepID=UPI001EDD0DA1|nr:uncharacterized protein LOC124219401 [Neodiprion pinetum]
MKCTGKCVFDDSKDPIDYKIPNRQLPLTKNIISRKFTITTDSFVSLLPRVYTAVCGTHPNFAAIPESVFQYYAVLLLWHRFAQPLSGSSVNDSGFINEVLLLLKSLSRSPSPIPTYLQGIGDFCDPDDCNRQFDLPVFPSNEKIAGIRYTFGKVNAKTHHFYEAYPAPGIAALRIMADFKYTKDPCEENLFWDLPNGLRPDAVESHITCTKPTKNLLGWAPAMHLTPAQLEFAQSLNIGNDFLAEDFSHLEPKISGLFRKINSYLNDCMQSCKCSSYYVIGSGRGSLIQGLFVEKCDKTYKFDRSVMYCDGTISINSQYKLSEKLIVGTAVSGYRMCKEPICGKHCWCCYDFDEYEKVPKSWIRSRNQVFTFGSVRKLNENLYVTAAISKRILQNEAILNTMNLPSASWNIYH